MSTDPAHSLSDAISLGSGPTSSSKASGLFAQEMDPGRMLEEHWAETRST